MPGNKSLLQCQISVGGWPARVADIVLHGDARDVSSPRDGSEIRGDRSVGPLTNHEQRLVLIDGEQWPLSCGCLTLQRDHSPNVFELTMKLRVEVEPHGG